MWKHASKLTRHSCPQEYIYLRTWKHLKVKQRKQHNWHEHCAWTCNAIVAWMLNKIESTQIADTDRKQIKDYVVDAHCVYFRLGNIVHLCVYFFWVKPITHTSNLSEIISSPALLASWISALIKALGASWWKAAAALDKNHPSTGLGTQGRGWGGRWQATVILAFHSSTKLVSFSHSKRNATNSPV